MLPGPYEMEAYHCRVRCVLTNKTPTGTYRAPGRFECNAARERLIDRAAREMGIDRVDLRMRNLIPPDRMPFARGTTILGEEVSFDSGDYPAALAAAVGTSGFSPPSPDSMPAGAAAVAAAEGPGGLAHAGAGHGTDGGARSNAAVGGRREPGAHPGTGKPRGRPELGSGRDTPGGDGGGRRSGAVPARNGARLLRREDRDGPFRGGAGLPRPERLARDRDRRRGCRPGGSRPASPRSRGTPSGSTTRA